MKKFKIAVTTNKDFQEIIEGMHNTAYVRFAFGKKRQIIR